MITPKQLRSQAEKAFLKIVSARLKGDNVFPWVVRSDKKTSGSAYSILQSELVPLYEQSKVVRGSGYSVDWKEGKVGGVRQKLPGKIYFETFEDFLLYIRKEKEFAGIEQAYRLVVAKYPVLSSWLVERPGVILEKLDRWTGLLEVCDYFANNKPPYDFYIRELPVKVHSKFIEQNEAFLKKLLDKILPADHVNVSESDFAGRYFLKRIQVMTQIRILDEALKHHLGYKGIGLPLEDASWLTWTPKKVFIIENVACFLSFPPVEGGVAIWGEGFKSRLTQHFPWLEKTDLYCWFDMDTAGFQMLNMIRQHYPQARNFLMNMETYEAFKNHQVTVVRPFKQTPFLTAEELRLYAYFYTNNLRLEQEFVPQSFVREAVGALTPTPQ